MNRGGEIVTACSEGTLATEHVAECDLCGWSLREARPVEGLESSSVVECANCGLVITTPRPIRESIPSVYPADYGPYLIRELSLTQRIIRKLRSYKCGCPAPDSGLQALFWRGAAWAFGDFFLFELPWRGYGKELLDIGCGSGETLVWAQAQGWNAHGLELDERAAARARSRGLDVRCGTLEREEYAAGSFDAITLFQVLEHTPSPRDVLQACHRMLKPEGQLIVAVPNFASYSRKLMGQWWNAFDIPKHLFHFSETTLRRLATEAGFAVDRVTYTARLVTLFWTLRTLLMALKAIHKGGGSRVKFCRGIWHNARVGGNHLRLSDCLLMVLSKKSL